MENWKIRKLEIAKLRNGGSEYWNDVIRKERIREDWQVEKLEIGDCKVAKLQESRVNRVIRIILKLFRSPA